MLGGMILPILAGVFFYQESLTWGLGLCVVFLFIAILLVSIHKDKKTGDKKEEDQSSKIAILFYIGVFVFNGMSGVINKLRMACSICCICGNYVFSVYAILRNYIRRAIL